MSSSPHGLMPSDTRRGWARPGVALLVLGALLVLPVGPAKVAGAERPSTPNLREQVDQMAAQLAVLTAALEAETAARVGADTALQAALAGLDPEVTGLRADVDAVQDTLAPFSTVAVDPMDPTAGYDVYLTAANLHIENGQASTDTTNGLGNLIVGYNELGGRKAADRTGSHNLVVGPGHGYTSYGGLIAGYENYVSGEYSAVSGGWQNTASSLYSSVSGGWQNTASSFMSSVSGGYGNAASGGVSSVSGGAENTADGWYSSVSGGYQNIASGDVSWLSGGSENTASGLYSSVSGGYQNVAGGEDSSVSGGRHHDAKGIYDWRAGFLFQDM